MIDGVTASALVPRRVLVVGGAGLIGGAAALHLAALGHDVAIAGRTAPVAAELRRLRFVQGSFLSDDIDDATLAGFDTLVFTAGNDLRQMPRGADEFAYFHAANTVGIPAFFRRTRNAGMERAVYVGSYYPDVVSAERIAASGYLTSRRDADRAVRALAAPGFAVCTLQSPFTIGHIDGVAARQLEVITAYCLRLIDPDGPRVAPPGGSNFMSARSFAQGVAGAIERGTPGKSYLMGDENWSYARYIDGFLAALGSDERTELRDASHPAMPDASLYAGRGNVVAYEPDATDMAELGVGRHDAARAVADMVPYYAEVVRRQYR